MTAEPGTASCRRGDVEIDVANADCDPAGAGAAAGAAGAAAADGAGKDAGGGGGVRAGAGLVVGGISAAVNAYCVVEGRVPAFFKTPRTI